MNNTKVHGVSFAAQPDIQIACDKSWTTPKWGTPPSPFPDCYWSDDDRIYTFKEQNITCPECIEYKKEFFGKSYKQRLIDSIKWTDQCSQEEAETKADRLIEKAISQTNKVSMYKDIIQGARKSPYQ